MVIVGLLQRPNDHQSEHCCIVRLVCFVVFFNFLFLSGTEIRGNLADDLYECELLNSIVTKEKHGIQRLSKRPNAQSDVTPIPTAPY